MSKPVIAIGLDAAEPWLIEKWMSEGHLSNLRKLREQGTYTRLKNLDYYRAETPWTTFLTGCMPSKTGYWAPIKFHPDKYEAELIEAYDFKEYPPFYALGSEHRVAVFDMPHARLAENVNGYQVLAWGAHSPQGPSESKPAPLFSELIQRYGTHPGLRNDHASCINIAEMERLENILETGINRRSSICQDLIQREQWDLFLTVFGETHSAGHFLWHLSQPNHPLYQVIGRQSDDKMLKVFKSVDRAVGEILSKASEDAYLIVFSAHGMDTNVMDVPSMTFLAEFLYRLSFPGKSGIANGKIGTPLGSPITELKKNSWLWHVWSTKTDNNPIRRFLRREAPWRVFKKLEPFLGPSPNPDLVSPFRLFDESYGLAFQAASWYAPCWPKMKAFALPSFSEGYVRINLAGRETHGIVPPTEYEAICNELSDKLLQLKDPRTGIPMVKDIIRTRKGPEDDDPKLPDADLVIIWQEDCVTDTVESPDIGRIGPLPHFRTGSHRSQGFFIAQGPGIEPGSSLPTARSLDLTPTILHLMGAPIPDYFDGSPMFENLALASVSS
jgi:predicted AlkP superfamily phosphohydrolase/phosphomutase